MESSRINLNAEIQDVYDKICQAFSTLDLDTVLGFFSDSKDMVKISNGKVLRGKKQLAAYWYQSFGKASSLSISIDHIQVHGMDDTHAWATADESISLNDKHRTAVVSNIFIRSPHGWKILLDHTTHVPPAHSPG